MAWLGGDFIGQGWFHPTPDDIFADDWSTEDQRLNLSRQQILDAINYHYPRLMELQLVKEEFFKTLGFRN
jgi:hypothetical protein